MTDSWVTTHDARPLNDRAYLAEFRSKWTGISTWCLKKIRVTDFLLPLFF